MQHPVRSGPRVLDNNVLSTHSTHPRNVGLLARILGISVTEQMLGLPNMLMIARTGLSFSSTGCAFVYRKPLGYIAGVG